MRHVFFQKIFEYLFLFFTKQWEEAKKEEEEEKQKEAEDPEKKLTLVKASKPSFKKSGRSLFRIVSKKFKFDKKNYNLNFKILLENEKLKFRSWFSLKIDVRFFVIVKTFSRIRDFFMREIFSMLLFSGLNFFGSIRKFLV